MVAGKETVGIDAFAKAKSSAMAPFGPPASQIADLWWIMLALFSAVFLLVTALTLVALLKKRRQKIPSPPLGDNSFIVIGGLVFPSLILIPLLVYTLLVTERILPKDDALVVRLTGHMWWWDVQYPAEGIVTANEIHIPVGRPVRLEMTSADVIHSFWPPSLSGKTDLIPGQTTRHWLEADRPGTFRAQCAEFCGLQHARMALLIVALPPEAFVAWVQSRQQTREAPQDKVLLQGMTAFAKEGCGECHTIRGTTAEGKVGPDLTHIGSRLSLGAGVIANGYGPLAGWVANPQALKPGNRMPVSYIAPEDYHPLISYLMSLE